MINDTVGTLMARAICDMECRVGLIVGTGVNLAYVEKAENIPKLGPSTLGLLPQSPAGGGDTMVINTEFGAFTSEKMRHNRFDKLVDSASINCGKYIFEKQIGGMYLGEIARHVLSELIEQRTLFRANPNVDMTQLAKPYGFLTKSISEIESDHDPQLQLTQAILEKEYNILQSSLLDRVIVKAVCAAISTRAARLVAAGVAAVCRKISVEQGERRMTVAVDGSVYKLHPYFRHRMEDALTHMRLPCEIYLIGADDGSGVGAAAVAAMMEGHRDASGNPIPVEQIKAYPGTIVPADLANRS